MQVYFFFKFRKVIWAQPYIWYLKSVGEVKWCQVTSSDDAHEKGRFRLHGVDGVQEACQWQPHGLTVVLEGADCRVPRHALARLLRHAAVASTFIWRGKSCHCHRACHRWALRRRLCRRYHRQGKVENCTNNQWICYSSPDNIQWTPNSTYAFVSLRLVSFYAS